MKNSICFIIPCFNVEDKIERCIDSILNQLEYNDKIIVIDDYSNDSTPKILQNKYRSNKQVLLLFNEKNYGVSYSRNKCLEKCSEDFVTFVDSDDYLSQNYTKFIRNNFSDEIDSLILGFNYVDDVLNISNKVAPKNISSKGEKSLFELDRQGLLSSCCNKIYRFDLIRNNDIWFNTKAKVMEDYEFNLNFYSKSKRYKIVTECFYNYVYHGCSSASSHYQENLYNRYLEIKSLREKFYNDFVSKENIQVLNWNFMILCINNLYKEGSKDKLKKKERISSLRDIISSDDFVDWKRSKYKKRISERIILYISVFKNVHILDLLLQLMHSMKKRSKIISVAFKRINNKEKQIIE